MKTSKELAELAKKVAKQKDDEYKESERKYREGEKRKKSESIKQACEDVDRSILLLEHLVKHGRYHIDNKNRKFYVITNYSNLYNEVGEIEALFYDNQCKSYWVQLAKELCKRGFKATVDQTENEIYDSMSTYTTYEIYVTL